MNSTLVRTSKFLSLILRHAPETIGLTLDENGWADLQELIRCANASGHNLSLELVLQVVAENSKKRFAISADGGRIRASQGHSIAIDLALAPRVPPPLLFHGTADRSVASIRESGLCPRSRQHVHLSIDRQTATTVGMRHGKPVILEIDSAAMHADSLTFYRSDNGVWLTDHVPVQYITFP